MTGKSEKLKTEISSGVLPPDQTLRAISNLVDPQVQTQVHGVDLTVKDILAFSGEGTIDFSNENRVLPETKLLKLNKSFSPPAWVLPPGGYLVRYNEIVTVPANACGLILPRSTLMRIGGTLHTALWDSGYSGQGVGLLIVSNPKGIRIERNARIGQFVLLSSSPSKVNYKGKYQNERGD
ncbi:MAG: deoxyuridine 5'-triphosphate nucleotidohydrolase [Candidatus Ranarchaeia archaeon]